MPIEPTFDAIYKFASRADTMYLLTAIADYGTTVIYYTDRYRFEHVRGTLCVYDRIDTDIKGMN